MRNFTALLLTLGAAASSARANRSTLPTEYACGDTALVPHAESLELREQTASALDVGGSSAKLGWRDRDGGHYVLGAGHQTIEFIVPGDPHLDATQRVYDANKTLVSHGTCTARGGYSDALARFLKGESMGDIARELDLGDRDAAAKLVHDGLRAAQVRYYREH